MTDGPDYDRLTQIYTEGGRKALWKTLASYAPRGSLRGVDMDRLVYYLSARQQLLELLELEMDNLRTAQEELERLQHLERLRREEASKRLVELAKRIVCDAPEKRTRPSSEASGRTVVKPGSTEKPSQGYGRSSLFHPWPGATSRRTT
ncbi:hypothetical protein ABZ926_35755 [Streptomyces litmocidini]|uniref:hypothetical protein n=1 Tax=Streptomyces litmocidini TaxID=67318 RepID=UPI00340890FB